MIDKHYPQSAKLEISQSSTKQKIPLTNLFKNPKPIFPTYAGFIRFFDIEGICQFCLKKDCVIEIKQQAGDFVTIHMPLMYINKNVNGDDQKTLEDFFAIGPERDQKQDFLLLSDEIAEIIARALSPGVNDPYTAITAINWLQSSIELLSTKIIPDTNRYDKNNKLRVIVHPITLKIYLERIFGQIFTYISRDRNTTLHMITVAKQMLERTTSKELIKLLHFHVGIFTKMARVNLQSIQDRNTYTKQLHEIKKLYKLKCHGQGK